MVVVSCRPAVPQPPAANSEPTNQPKPSDPQLLAVADAADPGPQQPLMSTLPEPLRAAIAARLGVGSDAALAIRDIREALTQWDKLRPADDRTQDRLLALGRGLLLAERAVAAGSDDAELLLALARTYKTLGVVLSMTQQGFFQYALQAATEQARRAGEAVQLDPGAIFVVLKDVSDRSGPLHRHIAARILREHGDHPGIPQLLVGLAEDAQRRESFGEASKLLQLAIARSGDQVTAHAQLELAQACYRGLDLTCGDAALARGRELSSDPQATTEHAVQVARAEYLGRLARRFEAVSADSSTIEAKLELAHLLLHLDHISDAQGLFETLRAAFPKDARPYGGLAKLAVHRGLDFKAAAAQVELGQSLANKDREFYEVALGTAGVTLVSELVPLVTADDRDALAQANRKLGDLRGHAEGYRAFEPARAAVMELFLAGLQKCLQAPSRGRQTALRQVLRALPAQVATLAAKYPDSPDVRRMVELAAYFHTDADAALKAVSAPLSPALADDPALQRSRLIAWFDITLAWERVDQLGPITEAAQAMPSIAGDRLQTTLLATLIALSFNASGQRDAGEAALHIFNGLAEQGTAAQRTAALNNAGMLQAALGEVEKGAIRVQEAATNGEGDKVALMNVAAILLTAEGAPRPGLDSIFANVAAEGQTAAVRLQAAGWGYTLAQRGVGDVEERRAQFVEAMADQRASEVRGSTALGRWGVIGNESLPMSFFYSTTQGFGMQGDPNAAIWWLIAPSPGLNELVKQVKPARPRRRAK